MKNIHAMPKKVYIVHKIATDSPYKKQSRFRPFAVFLP